MRLAVVVVVLVGAWTAHADNPAAEDRELAQRRFATGKALFARQRYAEALAEFEAAKSTLKLAAFDYNIGLCLIRLDRPAEAADALERYLTATPSEADATTLWRTIAELRAEAVRRRAAEPPKPEAPLPLAEAPEEPAVPQPVPQPKAVEPKPSVVMVEASERRALLGRAGTGTGIATGVIAATAILTGSLSLWERGRYDSTCNAGACDRGIYSTGRNLAITTDVFIGVGVAAAVTTIVLFVVRPKASKLALLSGRF
jgi:tetratricopeptide (TPR) repeat protein